MYKDYFANNYFPMPRQRKMVSDFKDNQVLGLYRSIRNERHIKCHDFKDIYKLIPYKF